MRRPASRSVAGYIRPCLSDLTRPCALNTSTSVQASCSTWRLGMSIAQWSLAMANRRQVSPAFGRLVDDVMNQEPYRSARRVFWIVDNGSSPHGERAAEELRARHPRIVIVHTPTYASWLNQIEIYFSIIQRKVLKPNDYISLKELADAIHAFGRRYSALGKPFAWCFTRQDLERRLREPLLQPEAATLASAACYRAR